MNATVKTSAFKSGNSVAVRLPKRFGIKPGDTLELDSDGLNISIRVERDPAEEKAKLLELVRRLREIGPVGEVGKRERIEFPDRPGLY